MKAFKYAVTFFMIVFMLLFLTGCDEITYLPLENTENANSVIETGDDLPEYELDEFGTPSYRWRWTYGLVSGELEVTSSEGWNTEFNYDDYCWSKIPVINPVFGMQEGESEMVVNSETTSLIGGGFWDYLQIRVNGELVRHRWPEADAALLVEIGVIGFTTEMFDLNIGRNEVILTAIWENNFVSKTIYLIRN